MLGVEDIVKELTIAYEQTQQNQKMISKKKDKGTDKKLAKLKHKEEKIIMIKEKRLFQGLWDNSKQANICEIGKSQQKNRDRRNTRNT